MITTTFPVARADICLEAVHEIDKLARVLPGLVPLDDDMTHYAVRGICGRLLRLTHVLMDGLKDANVTEEDLARIVRFEERGQG